MIGATLDDRITGFKVDFLRIENEGDLVIQDQAETKHVGMRRAMVSKVLIVGTGMCGMSLGVALERAGISSEIVEIHPALTEPGTGISLQGPALRALQSVGVLDQCIARGFGYSQFKACDAMGRVTGTVDLPRLLGSSYPATIGILRQSVHEVLADELLRLGVPICLGTTIKALSQDNEGVTAELTNGQSARYDLIVGAGATRIFPPSYAACSASLVVHSAVAAEKYVLLSRLPAVRSFQ